MPDIPIRFGKEKRVSWLTVTGTYKPGDPPPSGHNDWHAWAEVQHKAGLRQQRCGICSRFKFPQEIARTERRETVKYRTKRDAIAKKNGVRYVEQVPICNDCATNISRHE